MFMRPAALLFLFGAQAAHADCSGLPVFHCQIENGKYLEICALDDDIAYSYGPLKKWELQLFNPISQPGYTPWPGVSRTIFESVAFENLGYVYEVYTAIERIYTEDEIIPEISAGVTVLKDEEQVASLACKPETIEGHLDMLYEYLNERGQCWDHGEFVWKACE